MKQQQPELKAVRKSSDNENHIQKLLQPELLTLIPSSPSSSSLSSTTTTTCTIVPSLAPMSPTLQPPQQPSPASNKKMWFSPQVFLQSFPVFPPPTRNQPIQPIPTTTTTTTTVITPSSSSSNTTIASKLPNTLDISVFPKQEKQELKLDSGIQKKRKTKRNKIDIPLNDLIRYMTLPQSVAAKKLNVSLSTLKRRYYELVMELEGSNSVNSNKIKWPSMPTNYHEMASVTEEVVPAEQKTSLKYILNRYDAHDNTFVDTLSMTVLNFSFKQHGSEKL